MTTQNTLGTQADALFTVNGEKVAEFKAAIAAKLGQGSVSLQDITQTAVEVGYYVLNNGVRYMNGVITVGKGERVLAHQIADVDSAEGLTVEQVLAFWTTYLRKAVKSLAQVS